ncbi:MAG: hypothetical protein LBN12_08035 [Clostridiales Family XIII bacterium]|jgi:hypothetical protein|nr:hypothetical protein [Clostridiales Family XIII bacterium]
MGIREMRYLGKWLTNVEPIVLVCIVIILLILAMRFLPIGAIHSTRLGEPDKESTSLVRLYYTYWNNETIQKLIRLNAEQSQIPIAEPVELENQNIPDLYQELADDNTWIEYKIYTTVTPFNNNIDPFLQDRTWRVVIDSDPPKFCFV